MGDYVELDRNAEGLRKIDWVSLSIQTVILNHITKNWKDAYECNVSFFFSWCFSGPALGHTAEAAWKARLPNRVDAKPWPIECFTFRG
jgi:hypothetical protein